MNIIFNRLTRAVRALLIGTAEHAHQQLFGAMVKTGAIACAVSMDDVKAELVRIRTDAMKPLDEVRARLLDVEQKAARNGGGAYEAGGLGNYGSADAALRDVIENSADLAAVADRKSRRAVLEMPGQFFAQVTSLPGSGLALPGTLGGIVAPLIRRFTVRSLIPAVSTSAGSVQYTREVDFTNAAHVVSEGSLKPESNITFQLATAPIATIAHWIRASLQVLSDTPTLTEYISNRLRTGLTYAEDGELLMGSGVGGHIGGLMMSATPYTRAAVVGDTKADLLRRVMTTLEEANFSATGIVLNPIDWEAIALLKDSQGRYLVTTPGGAEPRRLWELPVVSCATMSVGSFLVGDFPQAAMLLDREQARIDISTETDLDFVKNQCVIRGEERIGLAILRPAGLVKGTFAA